MWAYTQFVALGQGSSFWFGDARFTGAAYSAFGASH